MGLQIGMEHVSGRPVLVVAGGGDEALLTQAAKAIAYLMSTDQVRVVKVDDLLLSNVSATRAFLAHLVDGDAGERLVLCCNRLTGRKLLRRWGGDDVAIFADASEAVVYAYPTSRGVPVSPRPRVQPPPADRVDSPPQTFGVSAGST